MGVLQAETIYTGGFDDMFGWEKMICFVSRVSRKSWRGIEGTEEDDIGEKSNQQKRSNFSE
jgi:hypothetical protein